MEKSKTGKNIQDPQHWIHHLVLLGRRELDGVQVTTVPGGLGSGLSAQHQPFLLLEICLAQHLTQLRNSSSLLRLKKKAVFQPRKFLVSDPHLQIFYSEY
jgi:hypothetical protein